MSSDLVKRLRYWHWREGGTKVIANPDGAEAADRIEALEGEVALLKTERTMREDWISRQAATLAKAEARAERLQAALDRAGNPQLPAPASAYVEMRERAERLQVECAENERLWAEARNLAELNGEVADSAMRRAERLRAALEEIASGRYSGLLLMSHPPQDPAVVRARKALEDKQ